MRVPVALAIVCLVACSSAAEASAWTKRKGEGLAIFALGYHWLDPYARFDPVSTAKFEASIYLEYGLADWVTLVGRGGYQEILERDEDGETSVRYGIGGLEAGARFRLIEKGRWTSAVQLTVGIPGSGENWINEEFGARGGDLDTRLQIGRSIGDGAFVSVASGIRSRGEGATDEFRLDLTAGTDFLRGTRVMFQSYSVWAQSGSAIQPVYAGHRMQTSLLYSFGVDENHTIQVSALRSVSPRRMSDELAVLVAFWRRF